MIWQEKIQRKVLPQKATPTVNVAQIVFVVC